ncbi:MAG: RNA polymerase sigma factor [Spirochaetota bacterium]
MAALADDDVNSLFAAHQAQLARYIRNFVGEDEAQDVLQDVFVSFLKQKRETKIRTQDELAWLYRACHNRAIDYIRRNKKLTHFTEEKFDRIEAPAENPRARAWHELREQLHALAIGFDKKGEGALLLHLLEEGKPKLLIAETLNISDRHLRRKVAQLFQYLQQELRKRGIEKLDLEGW